jgi:hypothetical protein
MRCGCVTEYDRTDHRHWPDDSECLLPEAVALIQRMADDYVPSEDHLHFEIGQFLRKVDGGGKVGEGG